ncbi:MAG: hypothetical protein V4671_27610 [Armatimonadota bacterium]
MFGDDITAGPSIKVCCGPRCGVDPGHRVIFEAIETAALPQAVLPTMCQGLCHGGVTVVWPGGAKTKIRDVQEAADQTSDALSALPQR